MSNQFTPNHLTPNQFTPSQPASRQALIESKLRAAFSPLFLEVVNESHMHSVPPGSESHFKVVMAAEALAELSRVKRHQAVYALLKDELASGLHALALHLFSALEWQQEAAARDLASPACLGGSKHGGANNGGSKA